MEFPQGTVDLAVGGNALGRIQFDRGAGQTPVGAARDRYHQLQITQQFGHCVRRSIGFALPLRFQKQLGLFQNPLPNSGRSVSPGGVQLSGFPAAEPVLGQGLGHALAVCGTGSCYGHQILRRQVRRNRPAAHLLLHTFRKQFDQGQPARHPTGAAIKPAGQLLQAIAEALLQFRQQPALFQHRRPFGHAQRTGQHQRLGLVQGPHHGLHRVPPQLLQRCNALVAVDHQVTIRLLGHRHDNDRRLLSGGGQRSQQPTLSLRVSCPQALPTPLQLMKLQSHPWLSLDCEG
jgi:hypothetical protein